MEKLFVAVVQILMLAGWSGSVGRRRFTLERLLRTQAFNREFERFDSYSVRIEDDRPQPDGSHEVPAVAGGKFSDNTQRMKVLFLIVDGRSIGGRALEGTGLPPCLAQEHRLSSSL